MCDYTLRSGKKCQEPSYVNSNSCILHMDFPERKDSKEFQEIKELKNKKINEKMENNDYNFEGAKLYEIKIRKKNIEGTLIFDNSQILKDIEFFSVKINGDIKFGVSNINGDIIFNDSHILGTLIFYITSIQGKMNCSNLIVDGSLIITDSGLKGGVIFTNIKVGESLSFSKSFVGKELIINKTTINYDFNFIKSDIKDKIQMEVIKVGNNAKLIYSRILNKIVLGSMEVKGVLSFRGTEFRKPESQENACKRAKKINENLGDIEEADYHFFREMDAKRAQKNPIIRFLELIFIQYLFAYGTSWTRVLITWISVVFGFGLIFWKWKGIAHANSLWENIYFSVVTATTLGYGDYHPNPGIYQALASIEAIFGSFMWAAFIVVFARKFMRR